MHNQICSIPLPPPILSSLSDAKITCIYLCILSKPEGTAREGMVGFMVLVAFMVAFGVESIICLFSPVLSIC